MASQKEESIKTINNISNIIQSYDVENDLIREGDLGKTLNFSPIRPIMVKILSFIDKVLKCSLEDIQLSKLVEYQNILGNIQNTLDSIKKFKTDAGEPARIRTERLNSLNNLYEAFVQPASDIIIIDTVLNKDINNAREEAKELLDGFKNLMLTDLATGNEKLKEINTILESAKLAAGKTGINVHTRIFADESKSHKDEAEKWLKWVWGVIASIIIVGFVAIFLLPSSGTPTEMIQYTITKVVILATLFYGLSICMKNYRANKHNEIVNKHRQNPLTTFETFVGASSDDQTKNAVLLQATMSIFANQQTGYSNNDNDGDMPSKVIEIIKSASPVSKSS